MLVGISFLLLNCQRDQLGLTEQSLKKKAYKTRSISSAEIPNILALINNKTKSAFTKNKSATTNYGSLDLDAIMEVVDTIGATNYSFRITNIEDDGFSLYNLVVHTDEYGNVKTPYIIKYTMEESFANAYYNGTKLFDEFTGVISRYSIDAFLNSHHSKYAKTEPTLDCPCDQIEVNNGTNFPFGGVGGAGGGLFPNNGNNNNNFGDPTSGGGGSSSSPNCTLEIATITYACAIGDSAPHDSEFSEFPNGSFGYCGGTETVTVTYFECGSIDNKSSRKSGQCEQDVNGNCPEDAGYVGVNTARIIIDPISFAPYPCQKKIVTAIHTNKDTLANFITSAFGGDQSKVNLTYKVEDLVNPSPTILVNGGTSNGVMNSNGELDLTIFLDTQAAEEGSDLLIAVTMIHENAHALLTYMDGIVTFDNISSNASLNELAQAYAKWKADPNNQPSDPAQSEHYYMTELIGKMADALESYGERKGYNIDRAYYESLCWTSDMAQFAPENLRNSINNAFQNERLLAGTTYSKGTKCP